MFSLFCALVNRLNIFTTQKNDIDCGLTIAKDDEDGNGLGTSTLKKVNLLLGRDTLGQIAPIAPTNLKASD